MQQRLNPAALVLLAVLAPPSAAAAPGLADEVEAPTVVAGATELSLHSAGLLGGTDHFELKLLMQRTRGSVDLRFNVVTERETGDGSDNRWEFGYAAQGSYRVSPSLRLGVQGFGDTGFDDQLGDVDDYAHYWGRLRKCDWRISASRM